jgi:hypothetical protein
MQKPTLVVALILALFMPCLALASYIDYCKGVHTSSAEDAVIQRLVAQFGREMGCEIGDNCLLKWDEKGDSEKFSIAWKKQCGPVIGGVRQLGDDGHGSTFVCKTKGKDLCCWPLGYDHVGKYVLCYSSIVK